MHVLIIGFTAEAADLSSSPLDVDDLRQLITDGDAQVREAGYEVTRGWIGKDHDAGVREVERLLRTAHFDIVLIGDGVRGPSRFTELFERLVNLVHERAGHARFAFNVDPPSTLDALRRNT